MPLPQLTVEGRVVGEVQFKFTSDGLPVARFRMLAVDRRRNAAGDWEDGETFWITVTAFRKLAENCADSLRDRDAVVVVGRLSTSEWVDADGTKRNANKYIASSVAPSLFFLPRPHSHQQTPTSRDRTGQERPVQDVELPEPTGDEQWTHYAGKEITDDPWA